MFQANESFCQWQVSYHTMYILYVLHGRNINLLTWYPALNFNNKVQKFTSVVFQQRLAFLFAVSKYGTSYLMEIGDNSLCNFFYYKFWLGRNLNSEGWSAKLPKTEEVFFSFHVFSFCRIGTVFFIKSSKSFSLTTSNRTKLQNSH